MPVTWLVIVVSSETTVVTVVISPSIVETDVPKGCSGVPASVVAVVVSLDDSPGVVSEGFVPSVVWGFDVGFSLTTVELPLQSLGGYTDSAWLQTLKLGSKIVPSGQSK